MTSCLCIHYGKERYPNMKNRRTSPQSERYTRIAVSLLASLLSILLLVSCGVSCGASNNAGTEGGIMDGLGNPAPDYYHSMEMAPADKTENEGSDDTLPDNGFKENDFISAQDEPISTFSADVDTASYSYFRKLVSMGYTFDEITKNHGTSIRTEEMLNYFSYNGVEPTDGDLFGIKAELAACPWNAENALLMLSMTAETAPVNENGNNLVFLIDVSGSMYSEDKLPLLKSSFTHLVNNLTEKDRISIVTYSGKEAVVLEACKGNDKSTILGAINSLEASGSTNGQAGLKKAYEIAESCKIEGGNNRIIMASDGDLNVGISSTEELEEYISEQREKGIYLSVLGFGTGNYQDAKMETIANHGNGVYYYIDGEGEAKRIFGDALLSTLYTVAEDVKLQITFENDYVDSYRLIGYENRILQTEDFEDDTKDAGEVGSGHTLTVCYELKLNSAADASETPDTPLPFFTLEVRHKAPGASESTPKQYDFDSSLFTSAPSEDFRFAACVIETAMLLHESEYIGDVTVGAVIETLEAMNLTDTYRAEFLSLLKAATGAKA